MTYSIKVLNPQAVEVGTLQGVTNAEIYEVINNQYVADVSLSTNTYPSFLHFPNMLEIDNDYFIIADIDKQRNRSKSVSLSLEHVSYLLNNPAYAPFVPEDEDEFYEGDIYQIINQLWGGIGRFNIIVEGIGGYYSYVPSTTGGRSRIQEFARQYGFEVLYNKFDITIRAIRGSNKGLVLEVGKNIRSISQKISLNADFYIEYAHEVDIVDFSEMSGEQYKDIASADLGDTVRMIDSDLAIDATERIVAKRYNPLFKQIPQLEVGQVIRDIIKELNKDEEEKKEDEDDNLLTLFKVGDVNVLSLMSDERSAVIDYIKDTSLQGIIPSADIEVTENKKGVSAALKSGVKHHLTAMITTETEDGIMASFKPMPSTDLANLDLPGNNVSVSVVMIITSVPFADLASGLIPVEGAPEDEEFVSPLIGAYGVRVLINDNADGFLSNFKIGDVDVLRLDKTDATDVVIDYIKGNRAQPIAPTVYEVAEGKLKGIYATLKANYKNHYLTFLYSTKDEEGDWGVETRKMPFTNARIFTTPRAKDDSVIMVITKEPYESITRSNVDSSFIKAFGVRIQMAKEIFLDEFKIGDIDMLFADGLEIENDDLASIKVEVDYTKADEFTGLFLKLKQAYSGFAISVREYTTDGSTLGNYNDSYKTKKYPNDLVAITVTVSKDYEKQIYGFKFKKGGEIPPGDNNWLSEFRIGNVDMLSIASDERQQISSYLESAFTGTPPNEIIASATYETEEDLIGLFAQVQPEHAQGTMMLFEYYLDENGTSNSFSSSWESIKQNENPSIWTVPDGEAKVSFVFALFNLPLEELNPDNFKIALVGACGVSIVKGEKPPPEPSQSAFRNLGVSPSWPEYDEERNVYSSVLYYWHKEYRSGEILGMIEDEYLSGFNYLRLVNYSGGSVKLFVEHEIFGSFNFIKGIEINLNLPSGDHVIPFNYFVSAESNGEYRLWINAELQGSADEVNFEQGVLSGVIDYISYTIG